MNVNEYLLQYSKVLSKKYPGKCIAIVDDKIIAVGRNRIEVFKKARQQHPKKEISITYIPKKEEIVTLL